MFLLLRNLTPNIVVLDSASGLSIEPGSDQKHLLLSSAEIEALTPLLERQKSLGNIEYDFEFDHLNSQLWEWLSAIGGTGGGGGAVVTLRPGDTVPGTSVVGTWTAASALLAAAGSGIVFVDTTFCGGTLTLDPGAYSLDAVWLVGVGDTRPTVHFPVVFSLTTSSLRAKNIRLVLDGDAPLVTVPAGNNGIVHLVDCSVSAVGHLLLDEVAGSDLTQLFLENSTIETGVIPALSIGVGEVLQIRATRSWIQTDTLTGPGDVDVYCDASSTVSSVHPDLLGALNILLQDKAQSVFYNDDLEAPALGADNVQAAIDVLKSSAVGPPGPPGNDGAPGAQGPPGPLDEAGHENLNTLVHSWARDAYTAYTYADASLSAVVVWTSVAQLQKIKESLFTYTGSNLTGVVVKQYDSGGLLTTTLTKTLSYTGSDLSSVAVVRS